MISIVTVTYKSEATISQCIESVLRQAQPGTQLIIIENSQNEELKVWQERHPEHIQVIVNTDNVGFGRACNQGLKMAEGEFVYFLNPDCVLAEGVLASLRHYMNAHASIGLAGCRLVAENGLEKSHAAIKYPGQQFAPQLFNKLPGSIAWVLGASMFARRTVLEAIGGFDGDYELYGEDIDICLRIRLCGHGIGHCQSATVMHMGGHSASSLGAEKRWLLKQLGLNLFLRKHYSPELSAKIICRDGWRARVRLTLLRVRLVCGLINKQDDRLCKYKAVLTAAQMNKLKPRAEQ